MAKAKKTRDKAATKKSSTVIEVDFTKDTSEGGGRRRFKEADYRFKIVGVKLGKSKDKGTPYVQLALEFQDPPYKGTVWDSLRTRVYITDNALWRVRSLYEACGKSVPKKKLSLDFSKLIGNELGATVTDGEPYNGKISSELSDFITVDMIGGNDVDDDDDEDTDDEDDEDDEDDDEVELDEDDDL